MVQFLQFFPLRIRKAQDAPDELLHAETGPEVGNRDKNIRKTAIPAFLQCGARHDVADRTFRIEEHMVFEFVFFPGLDGYLLALYLQFPGEKINEAMNMR